MGVGSLVWSSCLEVDEVPGLLGPSMVKVEERSSSRCRKEVIAAYEGDDVLATVSSGSRDGFLDGGLKAPVRRRRVFWRKVSLSCCSILEVMIEEERGTCLYSGGHTG